MPIAFPKIISKDYDDIVNSGYFDYRKDSKIFDSISKKHLPLIRNPEVLELGIGTGNFAYHLQKLKYKVYGIDNSQDMLNELNKNYKNLEAKLQDVNKLNLPKTFDIIFSHAGPLRFNHHRNKIIFESYLKNYEEIKESFKRIKEHLNKNGLLIMSLNDTKSDLELSKDNRLKREEYKEGNFIFKTRRLLKSDKEIWKIKHRLFYMSIVNLEQILKNLNFEIIGFDESNSYYICVND